MKTLGNRRRANPALPSDHNQCFRGYCRKSSHLISIRETVRSHLSMVCPGRKRCTHIANERWNVTIWIMEIERQLSDEMHTEFGVVFRKGLPDMARGFAIARIICRTFKKAIDRGADVKTDELARGQDQLPQIC